MTMDGAYNLPIDPANNSNVLSGAYVPMKCNSGYVYGSGQLNITCMANQWSTYPICLPTTASSSIIIGPMSTSTGAPCIVDTTTTFTLTNGYYTSVSLSYTSNTTATGSIQFQCITGYALDPTIGALYICNNGAWSPKPQCLRTARCSFSALQNFISSSTGLQTTGQSNLMQLPQEANASLVLNGSYILFSCISGYMNTGGNLNVTCYGNSSWSQFPNCVLNSGSGSMTTTMMPTSNGGGSGSTTTTMMPTSNGSGSGATTTTTISPSNGAPCIVDTTTTFTLTNGYYTSVSLSYTSNTTATGSIQFQCITGYALDPTIGALYTCNNGAWSPKPQCLRTARCSFSALQSFISTSTGLQTTSQSNLMQLPQEANASLVLNGSYILFSCVSGYMNIGGNLNVTCYGNSSWSQFPNCVVNSGSGSMTNTTISTNNGGGSGSITTTMMPTSNGAPCVLDTTTTFTLTNGYYTNVSLSYTSNTAATGSIQFACLTGYALDPTIGALYICNNGAWSSKPQCLRTARCSFSALQSFISTSTGLQTTSQSNLMQLPQEANASLVLHGSYILFSCVSGYMNTGGNLNVTCYANSSWSQFPNCVLNSGSGPITNTAMSTNNGGGSGSITTNMMPTSNGGGSGAITTTTISPSNGAPCVVDTTTTFTLTNGYYTNVSLSYTSYTAATGSIQFACVTGYVLDPTIGALYVCNNGAWSPKPQCLRTGRCLFSALKNFLSSATGLQTTGQSNLMELPQEADASLVLSGSYILFSCMNGYMNTGGNLNVTCYGNGSWSQFPNCVMNSGSGSIPTTTMSTSNGAPCIVDTSTTFTLTNGYYTNVSLSYTSNTAATGSVQFACVTGYTLDPTIGALYVCNNGAWSPKPQCLRTGRCLFLALRNFLSSATGLQTTGQSNLMQLPQETDASLVLSGSYILFSCMNGYMNTGGNLNVTCYGNGSWSQFPNCVMNSGSGSIPTTTMSTSNGASCIVDTSTTFTLTNGYYTNVSLSYTSNTAATGSIQFACLTGYALDPTIGALYVCNNGAWSPKPQCLRTGRCLFSALKNFLSSTTGLQTTGQSYLMQLPQEADASLVLNGSYILFSCMSGYMNTGGNLNVTCYANGSWSQFPNCVLSTQTPTVSSTSAGGQNGGTTIQFSSNCANIPFVANSYVSSVTSIQYINNKYERKVEFTCYPGYMHVSTSGQSLVSCINGIWDPLPVCAMSATCSLLKLQQGLPVGAEIDSNSLNTLNGGIIAGGWIKIRCGGNYHYNPSSGPLNITCLATGDWTPFPVCSQ